MIDGSLTEKIDKLITDVAVMKAEQAIVFPPLKKMLDDHETRIRLQERATENIKTKVAIAGATGGVLGGGFITVLIAFIFKQLHL